ncbi:MAG: T9SS type A sorting domain-containing protein [Bacteroidia bacterium]
MKTKLFILLIVIASVGEKAKGQCITHLTGTYIKNHTVTIQVSDSINTYLLFKDSTGTGSVLAYADYIDSTNHSFYNYQINAFCNCIDGGGGCSCDCNGTYTPNYDTIIGNWVIFYHGQYSIVVYCNVTDTYIRVQPAGIQQFANNNEISIYPNPASTNLTLTLSKGEGTASVEIFNTIGDCVHRQIITSPSPPSKGETYTIDVTDLAGGVYNLQISTSSNYQITKKVVIVR